MIDYFLKADTKTVLVAALNDAGYIGEDGSFITDSHQHALKYIGRIVSDPATYDELGNELTPIRWHSGYHANLRLLEGELHPSLMDLHLEPETPSYVWL